MRANRVLGDVTVITADVVHMERNVGHYREIVTVPIPKRTAGGMHPTAPPAVHPPRKGVPNRER